MTFLFPDPIYMPRVSLVLLAAALLHFVSVPAIACTGDCNGDGAVTVVELVRGVNIALGKLPISDCLVFDRDGNKVVTVNEIVMGVNFALNGCPLTATPTGTATRTPTPTVTPTPRPNDPPLVPTFGVYRAFPGHEIRLPINASDPQGDRLLYTAAGVPEGALLDELTGIFRWTPGAGQVGPFYVPFTVTDDGIPPKSTPGVLVFDVSRLDLCTQPACDPATGCQSTLLPIGQPCCIDEPGVRVGVPLVSCPDSRVLFIGRNTTAGFGRLQNCDRLNVKNFEQLGAIVRFNVEARCVSTERAANLHARMEMKDRLLQGVIVPGLIFEADQPVMLQPGDDGYAQRLAASFVVQASPPFFDFEGAEANLSVTLTDADGVAVSENLRLALTFLPLDDLPDPEDVPPPGSGSSRDSK